MSTKHNAKISLIPYSRVVDGHLHFERRRPDFLNKNEFETFYDRLGKYLHADNPWESSTEIQNLADDLPVKKGAASLVDRVGRHNHSHASVQWHMGHSSAA